MGLKKVLTLRVRVNLEVMSMKEYFLLSRSLEAKPSHQMQFSVTPMTSASIFFNFVFVYIGIMVRVFANGPGDQDSVELGPSLH